MFVLRVGLYIVGILCVDLDDGFGGGFVFFFWKNLNFLKFIVNYSKYSYYLEVFLKYFEFVYVLMIMKNYLI